MRNITIVILKVVIALALAGSIIVQAGILPAVWNDLAHVDVPVWARVTLLSITGAWVAMMQVFAVCVWRLLTLVRTGSVFTEASFRYVDTIIGAFTVAAALTFTLAVLLAPGEMAPGVVGLVCGAALVLAGIALLVVVMRQLLIQATARETEARALRSELAEVI